MSFPPCSDHSEADEEGEAAAAGLLGETTELLGVVAELDEPPQAARTVAGSAKKAACAALRAAARVRVRIETHLPWRQARRRPPTGMTRVCIPTAGILADARGAENRPQATFPLLQTMPHSGARIQSPSDDGARGQGTRTFAASGCG